MLKKFIFSAMFLLSFGNVLPAQTISVKEAAQLEIKIAQTPDDYDTRSKLLSYYQQGKTLADKKSLQKHRLGLIQNNPQKASYVILGVWVIEDKNKAEFIELKKEWLKPGRGIGCAVAYLATRSHWCQSRCQGAWVRAE